LKDFCTKTFHIFDEVSTKTDILERIKKRGKGYIFFPSDFPTIGTADAVLLSLHRLVKEKIILRLGKGIYYYPKFDEELGVVLLPSLEELAFAVANRDGVKIRPTGIKALNELGLSTQVPMKVVFLTSGRSKTIRIGKNTITFQSEKSRRMKLKGSTLGKLLLGLETLGKESIDPDLLIEIERLLSQFSPEEIRREAKKTSPWIRDLLVNVEKKTHAILAGPIPPKKDRDH
jgi:hypothetical protein